MSFGTVFLQWWTTLGKVLNERKPSFLWFTWCWISGNAVYIKTMWKIVCLKWSLILDSDDHKQEFHLHECPLGQSKPGRTKYNYFLSKITPQTAGHLGPQPCTSNARKVPPGCPLSSTEFRGFQWGGVIAVSSVLSSFLALESERRGGVAGSGERSRSVVRSLSFLRWLSWFCGSQWPIREVFCGTSDVNPYMSLLFSF